MTHNMDESVIEDLHAAADRLGASEDEVIEDAVRRFVGLEILDELWARNHLREDDAMDIAASELASMRAEHAAP